MTQDLFADAMQQLLNTHCTPHHVRQVEQCGDAGALWDALNESGFIDALVAETQGGAGLPFSDIFSIVFCAGKFALPASLAQTLLIRGMLGTDAPCGFITIAQACSTNPDDTITCKRVPFGRSAQWILAHTNTKTMLLPASKAEATVTGGRGSLDTEMYWSSIPEETIVLADTIDWNTQAACVTAALMAGAMERVFEITVAYANERKQFGKPIGKQQAIQQQLSVLAEHVFAARMAAQIGFDSSTRFSDPLRAAIAKERVSAVAPEVCAIAHAVHGAMGFTEEYDLQLFTRRLHEWRMAYGAESYWRERLGMAALQANVPRALDFVRENILAHS